MNAGGHWVVLFFLGNTKKIYYLDSFGNPPSERILNLVNKRFFCWESHYSQIKLQYDSYQCGVWCSFFVNVCAEYLKNYKNSVNKSESIEFLKFLSSYLIEKKKNYSNNLINVDIDFAKTLGKTYITKINQDATENPALENKTLQPDTGEQFFHEKFPAHLKFSVVSVDCQHTIWNVPTAQNGREYIEFIDKRFIKKYLSYADTVY